MFFTFHHYNVDWKFGEKLNFMTIKVVLLEDRTTDIFTIQNRW